MGEGCFLSCSGIPSCPCASAGCLFVSASLGAWYDVSSTWRSGAASHDGIAGSESSFALAPPFFDLPSGFEKRANCREVG